MFDAFSVTFKKQMTLQKRKKQLKGKKCPLNTFFLKSVSLKGVAIETLQSC